jgi:hypothetical protein
MNANQLWAGSDYAWSDYLRKGERYTDNASRVRVIKVSQKVLYGNDKASTFVDVWDIDEDTEAPTNPDRIRQVRARDIFMHWDEYADERERREVERNRRAREAAEREREQQRVDQKTRDALIEKGIPADAITEINSYYVRLSRRHLDEVL